MQGVVKKASFTLVRDLSMSQPASLSPAVPEPAQIPDSVQSCAIDHLPGFRRRFKITPAPDHVSSEVEDDFHCMQVIVRHDGKIAGTIEPHISRAPWTTCPGAQAQLEQTFTGIALDAFATRGEKKTNCTHLHDLAVLAAAHAKDDNPLIYDVLVSDPIEGMRRAELRRNGTTVFSWVLLNDLIVQPAELVGLTLDKLRPWIDSLDPALQEAARVLRWGTMIAHGRSIPMEKQSNARQMPIGGCYTFQARRVTEARRVGAIRDFSHGAAQPLDKHASAEQDPVTGPQTSAAFAGRRIS
jgi:hypothetical protein